MRILLTNDDGIDAPGLGALYESLLPAGPIDIVAPRVCQSATSHGITVPGPLTVEAYASEDGRQAWMVDGRPADCVKLALATLLADRPDVVIAGINDGANVSTNVLYSGTIAAAAEAALQGIPAFAVSLERQATPNHDYALAARLAVPIIQRLLAQRASLPFDQRVVININIPRLDHGQPHGVRITRQGTHAMIDRYTARTNGNGRSEYTLEGDFGDEAFARQTDLEALRDRYISITPLRTDRTDEAWLQRLTDLLFD